MTRTRFTRKGKSTITIPQVPHIVNILPTDTEHTTITPNEALIIAHYYGKRIVMATLLKWVYSHKSVKLYHQPNGTGGRYHIFKLRFIRFITGTEGGE